MDEQSYGLAADRVLLEERLTKMLLKYVLTMHYGYETTSDPSSVVYDAIYSLGALDEIVLEVPPR